VFDEDGQPVGQLDVGPGYTPGDELEIRDGVKIAFAFGDVSATARDAFQLDVVADSDTSDVLVALGMNSMFTGSTAQDLAVRDDLVRDPNLLAASISGAAGDGGNILRLLEVESQHVAALGHQSLDESLAGIVSGVALEIDAAASAQEAEQFLLDGLETRRDQVSGVNTDEELVRMIEQEQSYQAAAQYLRVVSELTSELMNIL
jgi:flagellar hook-associated protein FlgK